LARATGRKSDRLAGSGLSLSKIPREAGIGRCALQWPRPEVDRAPRAFQFASDGGRFRRNRPASQGSLPSPRGIDEAAGASVAPAAPGRHQDARRRPGGPSRRPRAQNLTGEVAPQPDGRSKGRRNGHVAGNRDLGGRHRGFCRGADMVGVGLTCLVPAPAGASWTGCRRSTRSGLRSGATPSSPTVGLRTIFRRSEC
jgi:hypothetical protein